MKPAPSRWVHQRRSPLALAYAVVVVGIAAARSATPCSLPLCSPSFFVPEDGAKVPSNLPAIRWRPVTFFNPWSSSPDPSTVRLFALSSTVSPPFRLRSPEPGSYLLELSEPLIPGWTYRLVDTTTCAFGRDQGLIAQFEATSGANLPTTLGEIAVGQSNVLRTITVATTGGSCAVEVEGVVADLEIRWSDEALRWKDVLEIDTLVDGTSWDPQAALNDDIAPGSSAYGRGKQSIFRVCRSEDSSTQGLGDGPHQVVMTASLPGTSLMISTAPIELELSCSEIPSPPTPPGELCTCVSSAHDGTRHFWSSLLLLGTLLLLRSRSDATP